MDAATATWKDLRAKHILSALLDRPTDESDDEDNPESDDGTGTVSQRRAPLPPPTQQKSLNFRCVLIVSSLCCCEYVVYVSLVTFPGSSTLYGTNSPLIAEGKGGGGGVRGDF